MSSCDHGGMLEYSDPVRIPRLPTARLRLREYRMSDFEAFAAFWADAEAMRHLAPFSRRDAWRVFGCNTGGWQLQGVGWWAVELRASGALVGNVGAFFREGWPELELGWNTLREHWGQGYATEAARAVMDYAFDVRREPRLTVLVDPANTPSLRVAANLGFVREASAELFGRQIDRFGLTRKA